MIMARTATAIAILILTCGALRDAHASDDDSPHQLLNAALDKLAELEEETRTLEQQGASLSGDLDRDPENPSIIRRHTANIEALTSVRRRMETQERVVGELRVAAAKAAGKGPASRSSERTRDRRDSKRSRHDRKGKRPAGSSDEDSDSDQDGDIPEDSKLRSIHVPKAGWINDTGKVHQKHTVEHAELQKALDDFWSGYDTASKLREWAENEKHIARERLADIPDNDDESLRQSETELNTWETWIVAVSTLVSIFQKYVKNTNRKGRLLHVKHKYGSGVARQYEEPDPHGLKGSKQDKLLQKAIRAHEQQKKNSGGNGGGAGKPHQGGARGRGRGRGSYGGGFRGGYGNYSFGNGNGTAFQGGREGGIMPPGFGANGGNNGGGNGGGPQCFTCNKIGHLSRDCPLKGRNH